MSAKLAQLNTKVLENSLLGTEVADYPPEILKYPERVIQFGEGNFLRAFVNWFFHQLNKKNLFMGRTVVVQPIPRGRVGNLKQQDNLYTLLLRGIQEGKIINQREIITSISRGLEAYGEWAEILKLAENPNIEFVVSNTTEAGIVFSADDCLDDSPPDSFPGKLTAYLYHRYQYFNGDTSKGMVIIPVELIEDNGDHLKEIVLKLAEQWKLSGEFRTWIKEANVFLNTLVDRIVTGYPEKEIEKLEEELGYHDENMVAGEIFHLWIIEGDKKVREKLPFHEAGLNVKWVKNLRSYRQRKVRILNGVHTAAVAPAYLAGIDLVRDAVEDPCLGKYMEKVVFENIIPSMNKDEDLNDFATKVLERFRNPFIDHKWLDISLNSISKFRTRVLPSLLGYIKKREEFPDELVFSLASLILFYKGTEIREGSLIAYRNQEEYLIRDDLQVLEFFSKVWSEYQNNSLSMAGLVKRVLSRQEFWGQDLNKLPDLGENLTKYLSEIEEKGIKRVLNCREDL